MVINYKNTFIYLGLAIGFVLTYQNNFEIVLDKFNGYFQRQISCGDWEMYRNNKCFKLFDTLKTYDESVDFCGNKNSKSELISIRSKKEKDFIYNYVSKNSDAVDDIWIGAKRDKNNVSNFLYEDDTLVHYENWDMHEFKNSVGDCLVMEMNEKEVSDKWKIVSCKKRNQVMCEYILNPTTSQLNIRLSDLADNFEMQMNELFSQVVKLITKSVETDNKLESLKNDLLSSKIKIANLDERDTKTNDKLRKVDDKFGILKNDLSHSDSRIADLNEVLMKTINQQQKEMYEQKKKIEALKKSVDDNKGSFFGFIIFIVGAILIFSNCGGCK